MSKVKTPRSSDPVAFSPLSQYRYIFLLLPHVNDATDAVACFHVTESLVDLGKRLAVSDELVHLQRLVHVVLHQIIHLAATLDTTESATLPHAASDKLER